MAYAIIDMWEKLLLMSAWSSFVAAAASGMLLMELVPKQAAAGARPVGEAGRIINLDEAGVEDQTSYSC